jgi:hypothetical protein
MSVIQYISNNDNIFLGGVTITICILHHSCYFCFNNTIHFIIGLEELQGLVKKERLSYFYNLLNLTT